MPSWRTPRVLDMSRDTKIKLRTAGGHIHRPHVHTYFACWWWDFVAEQLGNLFLAIFLPSHKRNTTYSRGCSVCSSWCVQWGRS